MFAATFTGIIARNISLDNHRPGTLLVHIRTIINQFWGLLGYKFLNMKRAEDKRFHVSQTRWK